MLIEFHIPLNLSKVYVDIYFCPILLIFLNLNMQETQIHIKKKELLFYQHIYIYICIVSMHFEL